PQARVHERPRDRPGRSDFALVLEEIRQSPAMLWALHEESEDAELVRRERVCHCRILLILCSQMTRSCMPYSRRRAPCRPLRASRTASFKEDGTAQSEG